jgi:hypothetical protein
MRPRFVYVEVEQPLTEVPVMAFNEVRISTERLMMGPWTPEDASAGLSIFGSDEVTHWLTPAMEPIR